MPDEKKELEKNYGAVLARKPAQRIDLRLAIHTEAPEVRAAFEKAKSGQDGIDSALIAKLTGYNTHLYRPTPDSDDRLTHDKTGNFSALMALIDRKVVTGKWDEREVRRAIDLVAQTTGLDEIHVWQMTTDYEQKRRAIRDDFAEGFMSPPASGLKKEIGAAVTTMALSGRLTPDEQQRYEQNLKQLSQQTGLRPDIVGNYVRTYTEDIRNAYRDQNRALLENYNQDFRLAANEAGTAYTGYGSWSPLDHVAIGKSPAPEDLTGFKRLMSERPDDDLPPGLPPATPELLTFLIALHESEHQSRMKDQIALNAGSPEVRSQAGEIDADYAVIKYLNDTKESDVKDYWLRNRTVNAMVTGVVTDDLAHDTATFLRVYEQTGKQIDIDAFNRQKHELLDRVREKLDMSDPSAIKTGDVMGAMKDLLDEDAGKTDASKKLSATQRAEAETFLRDAQAMGYQSNAAYPRPKPEPDAGEPENDYQPVPTPPAPQA